MLALCQTWLASLPRLRDWRHFAAVRQEAVDEGLVALVRGLETALFGSDRLEAAFERSLREAWWEQHLVATPALLAFRGATHAQAMARFAALDREALRLARLEVAARVAARRPDPQAPDPEMAVLKRQLKLGRNRLPVRQLLAQLPGTLRQVTPCLLMSPLSVAQYLDPSLPPFDTVIFD